MSCIVCLLLTQARRGDYHNGRKERHQKIRVGRGSREVRAMLVELEKYGGCSQFFCFDTTRTPQRPRSVCSAPGIEISGLD